MYDFEEAAVREFLRRTGARRAALQLPAGLARLLPEISRPFDQLGVETVILAGSCYGACDLADEAAKKLGCDVLLHYGHADMGLRTVLPTLFVEARVKYSPIDSLRLALPELEFRRVGLVATVQHVGHLEEVVKFLAAHGIQAVVGGPSHRARYRGQILGCDVGCAREVAPIVDGFLYLGTGDFHPLGVAVATGKKVVAVNPVSGSFRILPPRQEEFLEKRRAMVARAALGESFGVITSTKRGQTRLGLAKSLVDLLRSEGKKAHLLVVDEVLPEAIENFSFDVWVCAACPRIPIDDADRFRRPVLTPFEVKVMLGRAPLEPYQLDEVSEKERG